MIIPINGELKLVISKSKLKCHLLRVTVKSDRDGTTQLE